MAKYSKSQRAEIDKKYATYILNNNPTAKEADEWLKENYNITTKRMTKAYRDRAIDLIKDTTLRDLEVAKEAQVQRLFDVYKRAMEHNSFGAAVQALKEMNDIIGLHEMNINLNGEVDNTVSIEFIEGDDTLVLENNAEVIDISDIQKEEEQEEEEE